MSREYHDNLTNASQILGKAENNFETFYVRIRPDILRRFDIQCATIGLKRSKGVAEAITLWVDQMRGAFLVTPLQKAVARIEASGDEKMIASLRDVVGMYADRLPPAHPRE